MDLKIVSQISRSHSFTFSNISSLNGSQSQSLVDQQVSRLIKFIQSQRNAVIRKELEVLLPPIICHLFIEMLKGKEWRPAHDFLRKYACLVGTVVDVAQMRTNGSDPTLLMPQPIQFLPTQSQSSLANSNNFHRTKHLPQLLQLSLDESKLNMFRELISNLSCLRRLDDAKDNKIISNFRSCKYVARLANRTLSILNKHLAKHSHVLLIQILHLWFNMDLYELHDSVTGDGNVSSSSSSSSFDESPSSLTVNNFYNRKADRFTDPSFCDTHDKDIKQAHRSVDESFLVAASGAAVEEVMDCESNLKLKRLRDCLNRIDQKYHKPIRIFNINFTENR